MVFVLAGRRRGNSPLVGGNTVSNAVAALTAFLWELPFSPDSVRHALGANGAN